MINEELDPNSTYYNSSRMELIPFLVAARGVILDVGCGSGKLLAYLKSQGVSQTIGLELREEVAHELERSGRLDKVLCMDIETAAECPFCPKNCPLISSSLAAMYSSTWPTHGWFYEESQALPKARRTIDRRNPKCASHIPELIKQLVAGGQWEYANAGEFRTRRTSNSSTKKSMIGLLTACGYQIDDIRPELGSTRARWLAQLAFGRGNDFVPGVRL